MVYIKILYISLRVISINIKCNLNIKQKRGNSVLG